MKQTWKYKTTPNKDIQVQIRMSVAERDAVVSAAQKEGFTVSQWIRFVIRQQLRSQGMEITE